MIIQIIYSRFSSLFREAPVAGEAGGQAAGGQLQGTLHRGVASAWAGAAPSRPVTREQSQWCSKHQDTDKHFL